MDYFPLGLKQGQGTVSRWIPLGPDLTSGLKTHDVWTQSYPRKDPTSLMEVTWMRQLLCLLPAAASREQQTLHSSSSTFTYVVLSPSHNPGKEGRR